MCKLFRAFRRLNTRETLSLLRAAKICLLAAVTGLAIWLTYSTFGDLQTAQTQAQALRNIDFKAISAAGDLEYGTQESRRRFLHLLMTPVKRKRFEYANSVGKADSEVSILSARMEVLDLNTNIKKPLDAFNQRWADYQVAREDMVALVLQGRAAEALAWEEAVGAKLYESAVASIREIKSKLRDQAAQRSAQVLASLRRAEFHLVTFLISSAVLVLLVLQMEKRRG